MLVRKLSISCAKAHGSAHVVLVYLGHENDDRVVAFLVKLSRISILPVQNIPGIFYHHGLKAKADAEVWFARGTAIVGGQHFALESAVAEATGHNDAIGSSNSLPGGIEISLVRLLPAIFISTLKVSALNPNKVQLASTCDRSVLRYEEGAI